MKDTVAIPKWVFVIWMAGTILNTLNFVYESVNDEPKIHIHYHDERK